MTTVVKTKVKTDTEKEVRLTFTAQFTEMGRIKTRIQERAFKLKLPCIFESIGGMTEQTCGVVVRSTDEARLKKFTEWYEQSIDDLLAPRNWLGLLIKDRF